jgi:uncharacterized DUF497 family protein
MVCRAGQKNDGTIYFFGITVICMRFDFDPEKSKRLKANPERGIGFEEAKALFESEYITDRRSDDPEQFRAIGWVSGTLYSVIYEVREDADGELYHLVTLWKATKEERRAYAENIE